MTWYAYVHAKPDGTPFYVGKGAAARVRFIRRYHNPHHENVVKKYGKENILVGSFECSDEKTALLLERGIIKRMRASGVALVNLCDGGEIGTTGAVRSPETRRKMAAGKIGNKWNTGRKYSKETCLKKSRSLGGSSILATKDGQSFVFDTISEACRILGLDKGNAINHLNGGPRRRSVKGWRLDRVPG